jgi:hypothetical protein
MIKKGLKTGYETVEWNSLDQDRVQRLSTMNTEMELLVA